MALSPQVVHAIAHDGVNGDTLLGHLTRGDTVIPKQAPPAVHDIARQSMAAHGMDVARFVAGSPSNHINPKTGLHAFDDGDSGGGDGGGDSGDSNGSDSEGGGPGDGDAGAAGNAGAGGQGGPGDPSGSPGSADTGASAGNGPGDTDNSSGSGPGLSGQLSATAAEEQSAVSNTASKTGLAGLANDIGVGLTGATTAAANATGLSSSQIGTIGKAALSGLTGGPAAAAASLAGSAMGLPGIADVVGSMTDHGVDQASNPGGNLSGSGPGMTGAATDPGASNDHGADSVQRVLNQQTIGSTNGGTAAPDTKQNTASATDPFTDLNAALDAARNLDRAPTFTSGSDADILQTLLGQQHGQAESQLENAHARGTLSDAGFNTAEQQLGNQDQQARSRIGSISDNLLASYQQQLDAIANGAVTSAGNTSATVPFDITPFANNYNNTKTDLQSRLQGDILNLLPAQGGLYDVPSLVAAGGNAQGLYNPGGTPFSPIMSALADQRGLNTAGSF